MSKSNFFSNDRIKTKNLVEFKAGKMNIDDKNWVHPDKREGLVYIYQSSDGLTHFCWKDRLSGIVEDDLIVFPEDTEFSKITTITKGRVYVLKFKTSKKLFLWLQERRLDNDELICKRVNESLNNQTAASETITNKVDLEGEVKDLLSGLGAAGFSVTQNDIMTLLGMDDGAGGSGGLSNAPEPSTREAPLEPQLQERNLTSEPNNINQNKLKLNDLHLALSKAIKPYGATPVSVDLTDVINSSSLFPLLDKEENIERLASFLPPISQPTTNNTIQKIGKLTQHVKDNIQSPQMHAAVKTFGAALQSGDLGPVIAQFGLGEDVNTATMTGNLSEFAKVLESSRKVPSLKNDLPKPKDDENAMDQDK